MKRIIKIMIIGVCAGLVLLVIQRSLGIDEAVFMRWYWMAAPIIVLAVLLVNIFYHVFYWSKMKNLIKLLNDEKYTEYIAGMENLLRTAKGKNLRNILTLNLAAGYIGHKQFDPAITMLEELSSGKLKGTAVNLVHRMNLCMSYFETGQYEKAITIYHANQELFQKYKTDKTYGANIAILDVIAAMINEQYAHAESLLDAAAKTYHEPRFQKTFEELSQTLNTLRVEAKTTDEY